MARTHKDDVTSSKDVLTQLRRTTFTYAGEQIKSSRHYADALYLWYLCMVDTLRSAGSRSTHRLPHIIMCAADLDVAVLASELKMLDSRAIEYFSLCTDQSPPTHRGFKHHCGESIPWTTAFIGVVAELFGLPSGRCLRSLRTVICFVTRVNITSETLQMEAENKFLATEDRISTITDFDQDVANVISRWFPRTSRYELMEYFTPQHGPGAVSERCKSLADKYRCLRTTPMLRYLLKGNNYLWFDPPGGEVCPARAVFVPKSLSGYRTICAEPATLQWAQQGFFSSIDRFITKRSAIRRRINLRDQSKNTELAWIGSIDGSYATIDLSDASDSVSYPMVKAWFHNSGLREILACTRSRLIEVGSRGTISTWKFAPMGSALCFPIECVIFAAIVEAAITEVGGVPRDSNYRVYGDDIIVETEYVMAVISKLEKHGFLVNHKKSHFAENSRFRESCGGDFLDGEDVVPLRLSRRFSGLDVSRKTPSTILALIELANDCYGHLPRVRLAVIEQLLLLPKSIRPIFSEDGLRGLFSPTPTNYHLDSVTSVDWQCDLLIGGALKTKSTMLPADEEIRLNESLRLTQGRRSLTWPEDRVSISVSPPLPSRWSSSRHHH